MVKIGHIHFFVALRTKAGVNASKFDRQKTGFERILNRDNFTVSFLESSISLIEVLHDYCRRNT